MSDRVIKVGDRVRLKEHPIMNPYYRGRILIVKSIDNNGYVTFKEGGIHPKDYELELVSPIDKRTEFLGRLQSLLREFDAEINEQGVYEVEGLEIAFGDDTPDIRYMQSTLNADNIMDFEKEGV